MKKLAKFDVMIYAIFIIWFIINYLITTFSIENIDLFVSVSFFLIGLISIIGFLLDNHFLSINKMFFIFSFIFLYLAPYYQFTNNITFWGMRTFNRFDYGYANILIIFYLLVYIFCYNILFSKIKFLILTKKSDTKINNLALITLMIVSVICTLILFISGNLIKLNSNSDGSDSVLSTIFNIIRMMPPISLICYAFCKRKGIVNASQITQLLFLLITSISFILIFFPFNGLISRYLLFGTYIMIFYAMFPNIKLKSILVIFAFIGFGIIFPMFNFFKYYSIKDLDKFTFEFIDLGFQDYDAYQIFLATIRMVKETGISYGQNIFTSIFCLIPRSIWHSKWLPSGEIVAIYNNAIFTNISCPLIAEFYLSFGSFGIFIFTALYALLVKCINVGSCNNIIMYCVVNTILIGMSLPLLRGSLLPFATFVWSILLSYVLVLLIQKLCLSTSIIKIKTKIRI